MQYPVNKSGVPIGARAADRGCLQCPEGYYFSSDDALSVLEKATNNILLEGWKDYRQPMFPLAGLPVEAAMYPQMANRSQIQYHVFYPDVQRTTFYNPMPNQQTATVTEKLIAQCGGDIATAQIIANANSLGCAPPMGNRGISGKDRYFASAATAFFTLGPFCVTNYLDLWDFAGMLEAYKKAAINSAGMALEYEKIRRYVEMSWNNASAVAGTKAPTFFKNTIGEFPTSPGSFEWILNAVDMGIGPEMASMNEEVVVKCSRQLQQYWIEKFKKDHGFTVFTEAMNLRSQTIGYITQFSDNGDFVLTSLRTNRKVRFTTDVEPVYIEMWQSGITSGKWDFQQYYEMEVGDDPTSGQANGFRQRTNPFYGDPCKACDGISKILVEPIMVFSRKAFHYEAFPTNPLGTQINKDVETNLQRLWGTTNIDWYFGSEVQEYFLNPMNASLAGTGSPCFSNIDRTWFAGRIRTGLQFVEDAPRLMMTLFVKVPGGQLPLEKSDCILGCGPGTTYTISNDVPTDQPAICDPIPEDVSDEDTEPGCIQTPGKLRFTLPSSGTKTVKVSAFRIGGSAGALSVNYAYQDVTAVEGTHYVMSNGTLSWADGEDGEKSFNVTLEPVIRQPGQHFYVEFKLNWTADADVLCEDAQTATPVCLQLACTQAADGDCPDPYCDNCPPYS